MKRCQVKTGVDALVERRAQLFNPPARVSAQALGALIVRRLPASSVVRECPDLGFDILAMSLKIDVNQAIPPHPKHPPARDFSGVRGIDLLPFRRDGRARDKDKHEHAALNR
jgi:hypothetical protein